ncbi:hypothetical protein G6F46_001062 [Rhizopus delemar]|uniref:Uncharacterized protein n=3 Tax=Rhizopus TaxID=4842 RepID=I1BR57_RHIO9|nr:hypothetical protein RO3G_03391 [Rhizopus delemar RA 99-880]KAG1466204.1 hypothetical protein G6F55_000639 [Rhizopus delemar]KAG1552537.1 hypothetical protein G6F51_001159 [Rhizopus arrhizus]KAG1505147.1 hypothetical protein G6F54_000517 [Rhizopus delemar]KAG1519105.1 hypothetical protein G6F53_000055 [Rhizopus delemar]|eukprot:EIE78687.1 hypothetical protein RO3G_03391 [Rhizopus delemar RA 99-880]
MLNYEQICKILSEDQEVIDVITKDLLNVYEDSYTLDSAQILTNGVSVTYTPHLAVHSALPPIIIQFHPHASQDIMINAIDQCFQVYLRSNQLPVVLLISSDKTSKSFFDPFVQLQSKSYLYHLPNTVWSRKCLLVSERSFGQGAPKDENLNELVALSMCLLQYEQIIATLGRSQNAAIQHLYDKYKTIFDPDCNNQL